jgi:hypothetical protein
MAMARLLANVLLPSPGAGLVTRIVRLSRSGVPKKTAVRMVR